MSDEKVRKILEDIKDLKVSELLEAFNGIIIILPNGELFTSKEEPKHPPINEEPAFDVILFSVGPSKLTVVKIVKDILGVGLKQAKEIVDNAPSAVVTGVSKREAEHIKDLLGNAGATTEIR